ncbi:MAG: tetratricopeptide repeat protein, partial [Acidobacteriota bacterium]
AATGVARGAVTAVGQRPMTPRYASPEQIVGGPITTGSDVYSLGVLLYELLTGRPPYGGDDRSPREMERAITEEDPRPPSAVAAEDRSEGRRPVDPELDDVVLMAMHKDPDSRYASAAQLAEDLRRHGAGLPVHARRPTLGYRARKFVLRHRVGVAAAVLVVMSLVGGLVVATWQAGEARAARARTEQERLNAEQVSRFLRELFERSRPDQARGENLSARELLDDGARRVRGDLEAQPLVRAALMDTIGVAYVQLGLYNEAEPLLQGALDIRQEHLPPGHPDLLWTENHWAELLAAQGAYEEAERKMRSALGQVEDFLGQDHDLAAETRENLARALLLQSQLEEAETLLREALDLRWELQPLRQLRGEPPVDVASVLNNLALVLREGSRWREAAGLYRWALHLNRRNLGNDHPDVAVNLNNLAEVLRALGRCDEAVPRYEEALDLHLKLLGDAHPNVADTQNNLAGCLSDPEGYVRAEELYRSSLRIRRQAYGGKHPDVAASLSNLGNLMHRRGDLASAEQSYRESLALYRYLHGNEHHLVARLLSNLATVLAAQGNGAAAEAASREALDLHRKIYGDDHSEVLTNRHNLGALLYRFGRFEQAKEQFRAAWGGRDKLLGSENLSVANSRQGLGKALLAQGRCDTAEPHLRSSLEVRRRLGRGGVRLASSEASLGECLLELGRLDEAEAQLRSAHRAWCNDAGKTSEAKAEAVGVLLERLYGRRGEAAVDVTCSSSR